MRWDVGINYCITFLFWNIWRICLAVDMLSSITIIYLRQFLYQVRSITGILHSLGVFELFVFPFWTYSLNKHGVKYFCDFTLRCSFVRNDLDFFIKRGVPFTTYKNTEILSYIPPLQEYKANLYNYLIQNWLPIILLLIQTYIEIKY